jgi:hypothetical protein
MKKTTLLALFVLFCVFNAFAQYTFPVISGPITVTNGSPTTQNLNDTANTAAVPSGTYLSFSITLDWVADANNPYSDEARLELTTNAGTTGVLTASSGAMSNGDPTTLTFDGILPSSYDPDIDGTLDIILSQTFSGSSANWSNIEITLIDCSPAMATTSVVEDCGNFQFSIDVNITDLGNSNAITISNDAGIASTSVSTTGITTVGPFSNGTPVNITLEHDTNSSCNITLPSIVDNCPIFTTVNCGTTENIVYCYKNNDDTKWTFSSSDGSALKLTFNAGNLQSCCDFISVYEGTDSSGNFLYNGNNGGDLTNLILYSTTGDLYIEINSSGFGSCDDGFIFPNDQWDFDVECTSCLPAEATTTVVEDCTNAQFNIDVDITSLGDSGTVTIINDAGVPSTDVTTTGVVTVGPFPVYTPVVLTLEHETDAGCNVVLPAIEDHCPFTETVTAGSPVNVMHCYDNMDQTSWIFTSNDGSPLNLAFTAGTIESCCDSIIIYDGTDATGTELYNGSGDVNGNLDVVNVNSTSDSIFMVIDSDSSVSCGDGSRLEWDFNVTSGTLSTNDVEADRFSYYPNPVNDILTLHAESKINTVRVYNILGKNIQQTSPNAIETELNMSNFQSGVFFIEVTLENSNSKTIKIFKN